MANKKDLTKLTKKKIVNKVGKQQTVWVDENHEPEPIKQVKRFGEIRVPENKKQGITEEYKKKYPNSYKVATKGVWIKTDDDKYQAVLSERVYKAIYNENRGFIMDAVKKYNSGNLFDDRAEELKAAGDFGFVEGVNAYGKMRGQGKTLINVAGTFIIGRIKENLANRLNNGLRLPKYLRLPYYQYLETKKN
jgi:hypothetical protein